MSVKQRLTEYIKYKNISASEFCRTIGVSNAFVSSMRKSIQPDKIESIALHYPDLNTGWLLTGEGEMVKDQMLKNLKSGTPASLIHYIRLLPISAIGGSLNDFTVTIKDSDCEKLVSPIKDADFAITVSGNSMYPEFPAGSQILIKKIDETQFLEWGRIYVLDSVNGTIIKRVIKGPEGYYRCISANPDQQTYSPFDIPITAVYGIYRVLMMMTLK